LAAQGAGRIYNDRSALHAERKPTSNDRRIEFQIFQTRFDDRAENILALLQVYEFGLVQAFGDFKEDSLAIGAEALGGERPIIVNFF
jgi:hypothetical protein